jgi:hypothetical protein
VVYDLVPCSEDLHYHVHCLYLQEKQSKQMTHLIINPVLRFLKPCLQVIPCSVQLQG